MLARDVMTADVCTANRDTGVAAIATMMIERGISAVVVIDAQRRVVGIVSEGDLIRRCEAGTDKRRSAWREMVAANDTLAREYRLSHGMKAEAVMSRHVVCVDEQTPLHRIADLFEAKAIKRVPVTRNGVLVGIVSRRDLVRAFVTGLVQPGEMPPESGDAGIRAELERRMHAEPWAESIYLQSVVRDGIVEFYGYARSEEHRRALTALAETIPGVKSVKAAVQVGGPPIAAV
ncbi:MAG: CBS domain-containing protein [Reyranellaceae bacterium]